MAKPPRPPSGKGPAKLGSIQDAMRRLQGELSDASSVRQAARRVQEDAEAARQAAAKVRRSAEAVPGAVRADAERARRALKEQLRLKAKQRGGASRQREAEPPAAGLRGTIANILAQVEAAASQATAPTPEAAPPVEHAPAAPSYVPPSARLASEAPEAPEAAEGESARDAIRDMLAEPTTLRRMILLQEILAPPKSLRR